MIYFEDSLASVCDNVPKNITQRDMQILRSLNTQCNKQIGLTDRQFDLARKILSTYKIDYSVDTKLPVRSLDRSKWIRFVEYDGDLKIGIRFVFQKKYADKISLIEKLCKDISQYDNEDKIRYYPCNEQLLYEIVEQFKNTDFNIHNDIMTAYEDICKIKNNPERYAPGVYDFEIKNLHPDTHKLAIDYLGEPNSENLVAYHDRKNFFGLYNVTPLLTGNSLTEKVAMRKLHKIQLPKSSFTEADIVKVIWDLDRFPLLIITGQDPLRDVIEYYTALKNLIPAQDISVMFHLLNDIYGAEFNTYIKDNNINNKVDINKKVVFVEQDKINKIMIQSDWQAECAVSNQGFFSASNESYLNGIDLLIVYDDYVLSRKNNIEKIL